MFEQLQSSPPDSILMLMDMHNQDQNPNKIDLGAGIYKNEDGQAPIFSAIKTAEQIFFDIENTKAYIGPAGDSKFNQTIAALIFNADHSAIQENRISTIQTPGGSGALRVAAELILIAKPDATLWVSTPTWANHIPLLGNAGVKLQQYPYYDATQHTVDFDAMIETLSKVPKGDLVLLHGCCHNPTGADLTNEQWQTIATIAERQGFIPFIDSAYQGLANGLNEDAYGIRLLAAQLPEVIIANSCSKNFGVYRERTGSLSIVNKNENIANTCLTQMLSIVRCLYSMPPTHGASLVSTVLENPKLRAQWSHELSTMRDRIYSTRKNLATSLQQKTGKDFSFIAKQNGMFSFLGISVEQVIQLRKEFSIYMVESGRISIPGFTSKNMDYFVQAISTIL